MIAALIGFVDFVACHLPFQVVHARTSFHYYQSAAITLGQQPVERLFLRRTKRCFLCPLGFWCNTGSNETVGHHRCWRVFSKKYTLVFLLFSSRYYSLNALLDVFGRPGNNSAEGCNERLLERRRSGTHVASVCATSLLDIVTHSRCYDLSPQTCRLVAVLENTVSKGV
jgi:hypothetical protein